jgi:hypothetical protein
MELHSFAPKRSVGTCDSELLSDYSNYFLLQIFFISNLHYFIFNLFILLINIYVEDKNELRKITKK